MRKLRLTGLSLFLLAVLSMGTVSALADSTATMQLMSSPIGPVEGGVYTYPYTIAVNGTPMTLMCDTYDNEIYFGETWMATQVPLLSGKGLFDGQYKYYEAAALIFKGVLNGTISNAAEANFAIWGYFSANARNNSYYISSGAGTLAAQYLTMALNAPKWKFAGFTVYVPVPGSQPPGDGTAQEFMSYTPSPTPEPGTLVLLGSGVLCLAGAARRKLKLKSADV